MRMQTEETILKAGPREGFLRVCDVHEIHYADVGTGRAPILFLHGGPGGGVRDEDRALFDAYAGRVVFVDQRGAGRSRPSCELAQNTTWDLVEDLERLRRELEIEQWVIFGGSWGSTLGLVYALTHPGKVLALILHGIFLCRDSEIRWFYGDVGAATLYPDEYTRFRAALRAGASTDGHGVIEDYHALLTHADRTRRLEAAAAWARWEAVNSFLMPSERTLARLTDSANAIPTALMETAYFRDRAFLEEDFIIKNAARIAHLPCRIVQGRHDTICPMRSAWALHQALPKSELEIVQLAGHDGSETALRAALRRAIDDSQALAADRWRSDAPRTRL